MNLTPLKLATFAILAGFQATHSHAASLSGGSLTLNLDRDALIAGTILDNTPAPSIYVEEFWDASASHKTLNQLREDNTPTDLSDYATNEIPATDLKYAVNPPTIPGNPSGRENRATTFSFDPSDVLGSANGVIGVNGVIRFRVDVTPPRNRILLGDMTLEYHPTLENATPGRSGWLLVNHIGFDADAFELFDVTTAIAGNQFQIDGKLGFGWGFDHLGSTDARLNDSRIGTFRFRSTVVPLPGALWLFGSSLLGLGLMKRRSRP